MEQSTQYLPRIKIPSRISETKCCSSNGRKPHLQGAFTLSKVAKGKTVQSIELVCPTAGLCPDPMVEFTLLLD